MIVKRILKKSKFIEEASYPNYMKSVKVDVKLDL